MYSRRSLLAASLSGVSGAEYAAGSNRPKPRRRADRRANDPEQPHVVLVVTDDMRDSDWQAFPKTLALWENLGGATYLGICDNPVCGPARASLMTGRHSGNSGVQTNQDAGGGIEGPAIARAMQRWGYQTALFGKYLNGFVANHPRIRERVYVEATASVPAGWGTFETRDANNIDGLRTQALDWLRTNPTGPVFLYVAPVAPHVDYQFPDRYADAYSDEPEPERSRLRECRAVDDLIAALANRLNTQGRLRRTILVVVSDNGFHSFCEHGDCDKGKPYKESLRVTIRALGPSVPQGKRDVLVCPQDIPVTIAALAGAELNGTDGINFLTESRPYRLIQYYYPGVEWAGLAGPDWTYVEWSDGRRTFWDLARDPSENIDYHPDLPPERQTLLAQMLAAERGARENS